MKVVSSIFALVVMFIPFSLYASNVCSSEFGVLTCSSGTVSSLPSGFFGAVDLNGTSITHDVSGITAGSFLANNAVMGGTVAFTAGQTTFSKVTVKGKFNITSGQAALNNSSFYNGFYVHAQDVSMKNTVVHGDVDIYFKHVGKTEILSLQGSKVLGSITFYGNPGKICLKNGSLISGQVVNGSVSCS